jgi:Fe-S oxidoreductase
MEILNMLRRRAIPWTEEYVAALYACTGCKLCQQYCLHNTDVSAALIAGRRIAVEQNLVPEPLKQMPEKFRRDNLKLRKKLQSGLHADKLAEEAQVGFFPGQTTIDSAFEEIQIAMNLFENLDLAYVRVADLSMVCSGYDLWASGHHDAAKHVGTELSRSLKKFSTLVVPSAQDTYYLRDVLPALGVEHGTEILHISEFLSAHTARLRVLRKRPMAYYHDSSFLGRYLGVYDQPRQLMERCVESPREFFHSREKAECCGSGGLVPLTSPEVPQKASADRLREAALYEVDLVISACAECNNKLGSAAEGTHVEVWSLTKLLDWSLRTHN